LPFRFVAAFSTARTAAWPGFPEAIEASEVVLAAVRIRV